MANIADGWLTFTPVSAEFAADLKTRITESGVFEYEGPSSITWDVETLQVSFSSRWTCDLAWDWLDDLLADTAYVFRDALIACEINGRGTEPGCRYREGVKKFAGKKRLLRASR